ncbi:ComF family protein [Mycolicibacterium palauense]|uniref:ComF family protein n=1 Tax=Mycolicibacterium palauense TaxID=2034511 RepID=UPI000BFF061E|nr:ComF family protein [Mycolicibacterium palauense]
MLDLLLPLSCGGCDAPGTRWCDDCRRVLALDENAPHVITPRNDPGVPVLALGRYAGPRKQAILALKERGRRDLTGPLALALAGGLDRLLGWGVVQAPLAVVPAPTRRSAARRRGGDPVARLATLATATHPDIAVVSALRMKGLVRDSVGLDSAGRARNLAGRIRLRSALPAVPVLLIDDIVTTGATAAESTRVLRAAGARVTGMLALAHA